MNNMESEKTDASRPQYPLGYCTVNFGNILYPSLSPLQEPMKQILEGETPSKIAAMAKTMLDKIDPENPPTGEIQAHWRELYNNPTKTLRQLIIEGCFKTIGDLTNG